MIVQDFYKRVCNDAPQVFLRDGYHAPIVMVGTSEEGCDGIVLDLCNDAATGASFAALRAVYGGGQCSWYIAITEGWEYGDAGERVEVLQVLAASRDGVFQRRQTWEVRRDAALRLIKRSEDDGIVSWRFTAALFGREGESGEMRTR